MQYACTTCVHQTWKEWRATRPCLVESLRHLFSRSITVALVRLNLGQSEDFPMVRWSTLHERALQSECNTGLELKFKKASKVRGVNT